MFSVQSIHVLLRHLTSWVSLFLSIDCKFSLYILQKLIPLQHLLINHSVVFKLEFVDHYSGKIYKRKGTALPEMFLVSVNVEIYVYLDRKGSSRNHFVATKCSESSASSSTENSGWSRHCTRNMRQKSWAHIFAHPTSFVCSVFFAQPSVCICMHLSSFVLLPRPVTSNVFSLGAIAPSF